jgi:hypothetical protein
LGERHSEFYNPPVTFEITVFFTFLINAVIGYATHATAPPLPSGTVQPTQSVLSKEQNHSSRPGICHIAFAYALYRIQGLFQKILKLSNLVWMNGRNATTKITHIKARCVLDERQWKINRRQRSIV